MIVKIKIFNIIATINICLWFAFLIIRLYFLEGTYSFTGISDALLVPGILSLVTILFTLFCFKLSKAFDKKQQMSDGLRIVAPLIVILYTLITVFFTFVVIDDIKNYLSMSFQVEALGNILILCFTITSLYLCTVFWVIRKKLGIMLNTIVEEIGQNDSEVNA